MASTKKAEGALPLTATNGGILAGRDWQGQPIYVESADEPQATIAANVSDKEGFKPATKPS
jgi:hypothetical protein